MKTTIPEELKKEMPLTTWGKTLAATPVVMTVIATLLAGLASSEMTRAQYDRALGAQLQSKAGDQWSYFQAKKLRGAMQRNTLELLEATAEVRPVEHSALARIPALSAPDLDAGLQAAVADLVRKTRALSAMPKPILFNEDSSARTSELVVWAEPRALCSRAGWPFP